MRNDKKKLLESPHWWNNRVTDIQQKRHAVELRTFLKPVLKITPIPS